MRWLATQRRPLEASHADELRDALDQGFGHLLDANTMETSRRNGLKPVSAETA